MSAQQTTPATAPIPPNQLDAPAHEQAQELPSLLSDMARLVEHETLAARKRHLPAEVPATPPATPRVHRWLRDSAYDKHPRNAYMEAYLATAFEWCNNDITEFASWLTRRTIQRANELAARLDFGGMSHDSVHYLLKNALPALLQPTCLNQCSELFTIPALFPDDAHSTLYDVGVNKSTHTTDPAVCDGYYTCETCSESVANVARVYHDGRHEMDRRCARSDESQYDKFFAMARLGATASRPTKKARPATPVSTPTRDNSEAIRRAIDNAGGVTEFSVAPLQQDRPASRLASRPASRSSSPPPPQQPNLAVQSIAPPATQSIAQPIVQPIVQSTVIPAIQFPTQATALLPKANAGKPGRARKAATRPLVAHVAQPIFDPNNGQATAPQSDLYTYDLTPIFDDNDTYKDTTDSQHNGSFMAGITDLPQTFDTNPPLSPPFNPNPPMTPMRFQNPLGPPASTF